MSIVTFRKELKWTRWFLCLLFFGCIICDTIIHHDFEKFIEESKSIRSELQQLKTEQNFWIEVAKVNSKLTDDLIYRPAWKNEIMPSCFKGKQTK